MKPGTLWGFYYGGFDQALLQYHKTLAAKPPLWEKQKMKACVLPLLLDVRKWTNDFPRVYFCVYEMETPAFSTSYCIVCSAQKTPILGHYISLAAYLGLILKYTSEGHQGCFSSITILVMGSRKLQNLKQKNKLTALGKMECFEWISWEILLRRERH